MGYICGNSSLMLMTKFLFAFFVKTQNIERGQYPTVLSEQVWVIVLFCGTKRAIPSGQDRSICLLG